MRKLMNKKGASGYWVPVIIAIILFVVIPLVLIGIAKVGNSKTKLPAINDITSRPVGDALGKDGGKEFSYLNYLSYIVGQVPDSLAEMTGPVSAVIIVVALFIMFLFTFGDIISTFGTFREPTAWIIAFVLALLVANLKIILWFSVICFSLVAGAGALAVAMGVITPFVVFFAVNFVLMRLAGQWIRDKKTSDEVKTGAGAVADAIEGFGKASKAFRKAGREGSA